VECSDLSSSGDHWFAFMEENQMGSRRWFRKFLEGLVQECGQEHVPEVSGVTGCGFRASREVVPEQRDEPVGSEIVVPVESDQFFLNLSKGTCPLVDPD